MEIWKKIKGFDNYEVSSLGKVKNVKTDRILKTYLNHSGYEHIEISGENGKKKFSIHRLVLTTFNDNKDGLHVNHINHIKNDNRLENLEWVTIKENNNKRRERSHISKVQISDLFKNKNFDSISEFYDELMKL